MLNIYAHRSNWKIGVHLQKHRVKEDKDTLGTLKYIYFSIYNINKEYMSCLMTKPTKWHVRPAKTQISLGIHPVFAVRMQKAWVLSYPLSTQRRLSWYPGWSVFAGRTDNFVGFVLWRLIYTRIPRVSACIAWLNIKKNSKEKQWHQLSDVFVLRLIKPLDIGGKIYILVCRM